MQTILKLICWITLYVDTVLILCSAFTGAFHNGNPYAEMHIGAFQVTSKMPGGAEFIIFVSVWTGILAGSLLYLMKRRASHVA